VIPKTQFRPAVFLAAVALAYVAGSWAAPTNSANWLQIRYGAWGGPGVKSAPGPMDSVLVKDYAPKSSIVDQQTFIAKASSPVVDMHAHVNANTPEEVRAWVRTMDEVGIETTIILTGATGAKFDNLVELYLKPFPTRFQLYCGLDTTRSDQLDYPQRAASANSPTKVMA